MAIVEVSTRTVKGQATGPGGPRLPAWHEIWVTIVVGVRHFPSSRRVSITNELPIGPEPRQRQPRPPRAGPRL